MHGQYGTSSYPIGVTAHASNDTKGNWVQVVAATAFDAYGFMLTFGYSAGNALYLTDIAIGAEGSEQVIIPDIAFHATTSCNFSACSYFFPIYIPKGSRISARCQSTTGGNYVRTLIHLLSGGFKQASPLNIVDCYGLAGSSRGTTVDAGTSANTKGAYAEVVASATRKIEGLVVAFGNGNDATRASGEWLVDIAIGAAGSEQIIVPDLHISLSTAEAKIFPQTYPFLPIVIPAGTRIAARAQSTLTTTDRYFDIFVYGVS